MATWCSNRYGTPRVSAIKALHDVKNLLNPQIQPRITNTGGAGFLGSHLCERLIAEPTTLGPVIV